jgi:hypothetical protein
MTNEAFFSDIRKLYEEAKKCRPMYERDGVYRMRQHSISSLAEDLMAAFLFDNLRVSYKDRLYFLIDYAIKPDSAGGIVRPDIAIVLDNGRPVLASYIDLKTDLGFKREYFERMDDIAENIKRIRSAQHVGTDPQNGRLVLPSPTLVWRTVVVSEANMSKALRKKNKDKALLHSDVFQLYFLSNKLHPNSTDEIGKIGIQEAVISALLEDIRKDIQRAISVVHE